MTDDERVEVVAALMVLAESYRQEVSQALLATYAADLSDLSLPSALEAIRVARRRGKFFPSVAELLEIAGAADLDPDYQQVEAMIVWTLRGHEPSHPGFLGLIVERLGGWNATAEMPFVIRLGRIKQMLPAVLVAARARGVPAPRATTPIEATAAEAAQLEDHRGADGPMPPDLVIPCR